MRFASNRDVLAVMAALGVDATRVRFKGCKDLRFSANEDGTQGSQPRYVITYPTNSPGPHLAPLAHELAHVLQMEMAGGIAQLRSSLKHSRRIELGADYIAGLTFSRVLPDASLNNFQANLSLIGLYVELDADAHGTPEQRVAAFRTGVFSVRGKNGESMRTLSQDFQANVYARVVKF